MCFMIQFNLPDIHIKYMQHVFIIKSDDTFLYLNPICLMGPVPFKPQETSLAVES